MNVVVTGAYGFIGRNLTAYLATQGATITLIGRESSPEELRAGLMTADTVYHLASANVENTGGFEAGNVGPVQELCRGLRESNRKPLVVMTSSTHVKNDTPYGISKRHAEEVLRSYAAESGTPIRIYRLKNVFGKWGRPGRNGVVAMFCYNLSHDLPITFSNQNQDIDLVYVDDVVVSLVTPDVGIPFTTVTLGKLADLICGFRQGVAPTDRFEKQLHATYCYYARS